jgi:Tol biopolymer transport system component
VYRARDTKLNREVALKVLPDSFANDLDRLVRFTREAQTLASLNHPNIAHIHGFEESGGVRALVMELVEGDDFSQRIAKGAIPLDEALPIAKQIADALEAAHEQGIVHRDLKPGNIKITSDGRVKVLDFGLAKIGGTPVAKAEDSATMGMAATEAGVILGTAAYMSPEQARGKPVDKRTDIWAFGVVLYEMLTGQRPFRGETTTDVLAAVVGQEPDWNRVPAKTRRLLRSCLQKDPKQRLHDIADARLLLEDASEPVAPLRSRPGIMAWMVAAVFAAAFGVALWAPWRTPPPAPDVVRLQIMPPENVNTTGRNFALSPDGRKLAFSGVGPDGIPRVWVRSMDSLDVRALPGTETSQNVPPFFWSPDGRFIAYTAPEKKLKKVDLAGSPPQTLCETVGPNAVGGSWNTDGEIIFGSSNTALTRVSGSGGIPSSVTALDASRKETRHAFPTFLADGRRFLYLRSSTIPENSGVYLGSLDAKPDEQDSRQLVATTFGPAYVPSREGGRGQLLFLREGALLAQAFDEGRTELVGEPVSVAQQVGSNIAAGLFSASVNGVLVYRSVGTNQDTRLVFFNRQGNVSVASEQPGGLSALALSPDGERAALVRQDPANSSNQDLWLWDTTRANSSRVTFDPRRAESPVWFPDGGRLIFRSNREGSWNLYRKLSNESKDDEALVKSGPDKTPTSISPDGRFLLYTQSDPQTKNDVWILSNPGAGQGDRKPTPFLRSESNESEARFSPDPESGTPSGRRWVAYTSDESRRNEVYVREFPQNPTARKWPVSNAGGTNPRWRADGKELFFAAPDGTIMSVDVTPGLAFQVSAPKALFKVPSGILSNWDVTSDGTRFLVLLQQSAQAPFTVLQNWQSALTR